MFIGLVTQLLAMGKEYITSKQNKHQTFKLGWSEQNRIWRRYTQNAGMQRDANMGAAEGPLPGCHCVHVGVGTPGLSGSHPQPAHGSFQVQKVLFSVLLGTSLLP